MFPSRRTDLGEGSEWAGPFVAAYDRASTDRCTRRYWANKKIILPSGGRYVGMNKHMFPVVGRRKRGVVPSGVYIDVTGLQEDSERKKGRLGKERNQKVSNQVQSR